MAVEKHIIFCIGEEGDLGHPRVYLNFNAQGNAICPYCDKIFTRDKDNTSAS